MNVPVILRRRRRVGFAFSPLSLFADAIGVWYEPSTTTAFLSTTDLTPCGYGQACGFLLDKSQGAGYSGGSFTGLGSELVTNGTFDTDSDWVKVENWTISGGAANYDGVNLPTNRFIQALSVTVGSFYLVSFDVVFGGGPNELLIVALGDSTSSSERILVPKSGGDGTYTFYMEAFSSQIEFFANRTATSGTVFSGTIDNISVRELPGNHATQSTAASRPTLARVPSTGRRNLLERTEEFDNAYWTKREITITSNATEAPNGEATADKVVPSANESVKTLQVATNPTFESGVQYTLSGHFKAGEISHVRLLFGSALTGASTAVWFNVSAGTVGTILGAGLIDDYGVEDLGGGWYRCYYTVTSILDGSTPTNFIFSSADNDASYTGNASDGLFVWGAQLEEASSATAYQRVVDQYDITEAGVDSLDYLSFDGTDDGMATAAIDFTSTDKMSVFAGVEKTDDSTGYFIAELSASASSNNGAFYTAANSFSGTADWAVFSHGTAAAAPSQVAASNDSQSSLVILSGLHDISGDSNILRIDGAQVDEATADLGAGNFGNYPLYICSRAGTSLFLDGNLYGLIVRGASSDATAISNTETYLANRSGVTL
jgi:hypothetical protein